MSDKLLKLGVIGMSEGNGHPYSWSAICNGYQPEAMQECPFPVIPDYLKKEEWPAAKIPNVCVSHIWTQDTARSHHIARAAKIENVVTDLTDLIGRVDAILLARDDARRHPEMAMPFLKAGLPLFIDKPLALSVREARQMINAQQYEGQLFSCSSLRYASELALSREDKASIGSVLWIEASIPKAWDTYAVHLIEPIVANNPNRGNYQKLTLTRQGKEMHQATAIWENLSASITTYGKYSMPLEIIYFGENGLVRKSFTHTFAAFKKSIEMFIDGIEKNYLPISRDETLEIVQIIEDGHCA